MACGHQACGCTSLRTTSTLFIHRTRGTQGLHGPASNPIHPSIHSIVTSSLDLNPSTEEMGAIQEDDDISSPVLMHPTSDAALTTAAAALAESTADVTPITSSTWTTTSYSSSEPHLHDHSSTPKAIAPARIVDKNWARVRQKMIGAGSDIHSSHSSNISETDLQGAYAKSHLSAVSSSSRPPSTTQTEPSKALSGMEDTGSTPATGLRGVLGFRTVVVQRTQLRKMEKEIEKALARHANDQSQPRSRAVARMGTSTRGMIPGAPYNLMVMPEPTNVDRSLVDELSDILLRWKNLTVEVPCKPVIFRTLAKMLLADRPEPLSRADSMAVLNLFDQMRYMFPLKNDPEDIQEVLWCINLLSRKYACKKGRVIFTVRELLGPKVLTATRYWVEPVSKYPMSMDEPIRVFGRAASDLVLSSPVAYAEQSELMRSLILDLMLFIKEFMSPSYLDGIVSKETVSVLVRYILAVFSVEYPEIQQQERVSTDNFRTPYDEQSLSRRTSIATEVSQEYAPVTPPPRSPVSPNVSGENFQARSLPPQVPNMVMDEQLNPVLYHARAYFDTLWSSGYQEAIINQLKTEKLVAHQPEPSERLSQLLLQLSVMHRAAFFKPMIACVASDSTQFVTDYLCILSCLETHMELVDLYMKDADMICVIMMTDVGPERPRLDSQTQVLKWGSCTVGQCVVILEFIYAIKRLSRSGDNHQVEIGKMFLIDLERKLGLYLVSKEKRILVPRPLRVLLCLVFYEIRMLCKTIHRPGWMSRILDWAINHDLPSEAGNTQGTPNGFSDTMRLRIKHIYNSVDGLIGEHRDRSRDTRKVFNNITATSRTVSSSSNKQSTTLDAFKRTDESIVRKKAPRSPRLGRLPDIQLDETVAVLKLLITVHSAIHASEYLQLIEPLWSIYCLESRPKVASSAAFLFVKCADIAPKTIYNLVIRDLTSEDPYKRLSAIERLHGLFDHRNELLSQPYVIDPSSRGPFRTTTIQVPFVISEVGSNRYTMDEPRWLTELKSAGNFPPDIRRRFQELGWGEKDQQEMEMTRRIQTPLMLSWTGYLDEDYENKSNFGWTHTVLPQDRHATILIPVLNSLNLGTIELLDDKSVGVRTAASNFLSDYIRNEPVLLVRSFFAEIASARPDRQRDLISRLHLLLSFSSNLPPAFAFALFNHLLGLLKWFQRNSKPLGLDMLAVVLPLLADVVPSTNDIVFKDFKRNKVDVFFATMGRFWFKPNLTPESMFPSKLTNFGQVLPRLDIPHQLFQMAMININQVQFMTSFLVRFPLEVHDIKANIGRFSRMPKLDAAVAAAGPKMEDNQYLPDVSRRKAHFIPASSIRDRSLRSLSSLRARAWLCFVLNLIQRMEKNNVERLEVMNIFNGVNVILLEHGNDLGIVGQALDVYVTAAMRLRRFFASQNGYSLIFPALFKIYCDSWAIKQVQEIIDAVFYRFYLVHQEAFVLQSLGAIVPLMLRGMSSEQSDIVARGLFAFLEALDQPTTACRANSLGVQSLAEPYQQRSTYGPQLEIPSWMRSFIPADSKLFQSSNLLQKREFTIADSIKLFLAIIAYDPGSLRSEQFVRVLKMIMPYFLDKEPTLMAHGLGSLIEIFARFSRSSRPLTPTSFVPPPVAPRQVQDTEDSRSDVSRFALFSSPLYNNQAVKGKTWAQNDRVAVKHEFMCLVQLFCDRGGKLADTQHQQMAALIRSLVKDYSHLKIPCTTEWIKDYIKSVVLTNHSASLSSNAASYIVVQFSSILRTHYKSIDFSGFLDGLLLVVEDHRRLLQTSPELCNIFRERIANPALTVAVKGEWTTDSIYISQASFCSSLVDLILAMINSANTDTISELEQASPTPRFIAYIVIPLCLRFKTRFHDNFLDILEMQFWLRMLGLVVKAAEYDPTSRRSSRTAELLAPVLNVTRVNKKRPSIDAISPLSPQQVHVTLPPAATAPLSANLSPQTPAQSTMPSLQINDNDHNEDVDQPPTLESPLNASPGLMVDFIALRIIMVRGERYLTYHPGCWLDIFSIIKKYFSLHASVAHSFSSPAASGIGIIRQNSSSGSGPTSPNISTPFPGSPRVDGPMTPRTRQASGAFSYFPSLLRSSGEMTPFPGPTHTKENIPTTGMGFILWSFAETIIFNRLPLMIMMRPFLLDQLRLLDRQPQTRSLRHSRAASTASSNSPAFYWPSPAIGSTSPGISPLHPRTESGANETIASQDPAEVKRRQREERRKQWKSWSKPTLTMNALTAMDEPLQGPTSPMSPRPVIKSHQRQLSLASISEHGGIGASNTPRLSISRHQNKSQRLESEKAEQVLPKVLVERANRSLRHVRTMLNASLDGRTTFSDAGTPMYPEKQPLPSPGLSPSMARFGDKRDSSQFLSADSAQGHGHQFLVPGRYERQPVSPGFGSMFLAREAALKASTNPPISEPSTPGPLSVQPSQHQHPLSLTVPNPIPSPGRVSISTNFSNSDGVRRRAETSDDSPYFVNVSPSLTKRRGLERQSLPTINIEDSSHLGTSPPVTATSTDSMSKKARNILIPRIITSPPPIAESVEIPYLEAPAELSPAVGQSRKEREPIRRVDSRHTEDGTSTLSGGVSISRRCSLSIQDQTDYQMACLQARTKIFMQNIVEETRTVLACFPSVFSIGSLASSTFSSANPAPSVANAPPGPSSTIPVAAATESDVLGQQSNPI
ncbi:hypothetical protein BGZ51_009549 [Haplosporangium sp. Z 767]|nr:hypothetical protein BGZ51_009549 [Haplosporangium sp. Z 767]